MLSFPVRASSIALCAVAQLWSHGAAGEGGLVDVQYWQAGYYSPGNCPAGQGHPSMTHVTAACDGLGPAPWPYAMGVDEWEAQTGRPYSSGGFPCQSMQAPGPGPAVGTTCGQKKTDPPACKVGLGSADARKSTLGLVGDPVDLTSSTLSLDPVDVDLADGLRFARHYSSASTSATAMGTAWRHSLDWKLSRKTIVAGVSAYVVAPPMQEASAFVGSGTSFVNNIVTGGSLSSDASGFHFTGADGVQADFDNSNRLTAIRSPGELPITVTHGTNSSTFSRGSQALVVSLYPVGHANAGLVSSVAANGETWTYTYGAGNYLAAVVGPDPSTASPTDTATWTYTYATYYSLLTRVDRSSSAGVVTLGQWAFTGIPLYLTSADEAALEQPLVLSYVALGAGNFRATVKNASNQTLAVVDSTKGAVASVSNTSGPASPVAGGPGVPVPFKAVTFTDTFKFLPKTQTDQNGNVTLYENYDSDARPGRVVEGWIDGPTMPGVFSGDDTFASLVETTWHPVLREPLTESSPSVLPGGGTHTTIFDYDDPAAPGDNPLLPNQAPTNRLYARTDQGYTLDASGAVVLAAYKTSFGYDSAGRVTSESGPRPENYTQYLYDAGTGYRTATRRYLNGPTSAYLETTSSSFDSRGNPQTITDPNGRATLYTYDSVGRVKTVTPPFSGASSTITFSYDLDGNLTRVDFPPDSFAQPSCASATTRRTASRSSPTRAATPSSTSARADASRARRSTAASSVWRAAAR
jgi:YD repeat-containing protein